MFPSLYHLLFVGCCLVLLAAPASAGDLAEVREKGLLRVAVYKDYPPYSYLEKGKMVGVDVDLAKALAERLGVGMSTMNLTASDEAMEDDLRNAIWKGHYLGTGTADVMLHVPVDEAFAAANDQVTIFGPYYQEQVAIAHHRERLSEIPSMALFASTPIAVELETISDGYLSWSFNRRLLPNVVRFRHFPEACGALHQGEVPALMAPIAQLEYCLQTGEADAFAISEVPGGGIGLFRWTVGMAVKEDHDELAAALETALAGLVTDGTLEAIYQRHGLSYRPPPVALSDAR
ncbi:MAG: substrate-binding periplasmic protein [Candidatus Competibacterales bacterium]